MSYFTYIKKGLPLYIVSSIVLALAVFSLITVHRYNRRLDDTISVIKEISQKKHIVKNEIDKSAALIKFIREDLDADMAQANPERLLFHALDDIKSNLPNALIIVSRFEETGNKNELPVEIEAGMDNYRMILDYVAYIESFRIPDFKVTRLAVSKGQTGGVVLKITGVLLIPSSDNPV